MTRFCPFVHFSLNGLLQWPHPNFIYSNDYSKQNLTAIGIQPEHGIISADICICALHKKGCINSSDNAFINQVLKFEFSYIIKALHNEASVERVPLLFLLEET